MANFSFDGKFAQDGDLHPNLSGATEPINLSAISDFAPNTLWAMSSTRQDDPPRSVTCPVINSRVARLHFLAPHKSVISLRTCLGPAHAAYWYLQAMPVLTGQIAEAGETLRTGGAARRRAVHT